MTITAASIIQRVQNLAQDNTGVRWPVSELVTWANDGQRAIALHRPDSTSVVGTGTLAAGTRQTLVGMTGITNPAKLLDVIRNLAASSAKKAVRKVSREILDSQNAAWHAATQEVNVVHFTYDERDPLAFYVYPPATTLAQLEILYSAYPTDISAPSGNTYDTVSGNISVKDVYANALVDYILFRAYMKDAEFAANGQRAVAHLQAFAADMGVDLKALMATMPGVNVTFNPNDPKGGSSRGAAAA